MKPNEVSQSFERMGISVTQLQIDQFIMYYQLLIEWNQRMNLTAITDSGEVLVKHFLDSVISCKVIDFQKYVTLIDIGTGAGLPGIPLKILYPHLQVTLVDALSKRITFLEEVIDSLGLQGVTAIHGRAEDLARTELRESFEICVSRAVSQLNILCEYCLPFICVGGVFVSYKGSKTLEELADSNRAITLLGGQLNRVTDQVALTHDINRGFVLIDKVASTDERYPRRAGKPSKKPL